MPAAIEIKRSGHTPEQLGERAAKANARNSAHNRRYGKFRQFTEAIFGFFDKMLPESSESLIDATADNFRVIGHEDRLFVG